MIISTVCIFIPFVYLFQKQSSRGAPPPPPKKKIKGAVTDMRYFARSKFSVSLVHKKNSSMIRQVVFKLGYVFCQKRYDSSFKFE